MTVVQIKDSINRVRPLMSGWNPPPIKPGAAVFVDIEANVIEAHAGTRRSAGDRARGMEEHLPLPLVKKKAESAIPAARSQQKGSGEGRN